MPFAQPTLKTIIDRIVADINARLPEGDARLATSILNVLACANGGAINGLYGYLNWMARQIMMDTAELEHLERWASIWDIRRKPEAHASGTVSVKGIAGSVVPGGTLLQRSDGQQYATITEAQITEAGVVNVDVVALQGGSKSNAHSGASLVLVSPVEGVAASSVSDNPVTGGVEAESDESLRSRLLERVRNPPHGGAHQDYITWALEVEGVTRAWLAAGEMGAGTVTLRFVCDHDPSGIFPSELKIAEVRQYILSRRPVTSELFVVSPIPIPVNFTIRAVSPDTAAVRSAITAELSDLILREAVPGGTILLSHIRAAISAAKGEYDHHLIAPAVDVKTDLGHMSTLGVITWA